jgi:hypothetical protein
VKTLPLVASFLFNARLARTTVNAGAWRYRR